MVDALGKVHALFAAGCRRERVGRAAVEEDVNLLAAAVRTRAACRTLAVPRATLHRHRNLKPVVTGARRQSKSHRRLSDCEQRAICEVAQSERFADLSVREIHATLLDEGTYLSSISTMYRVLRRAGETRERRRLATHPARVKPELAASGPRQVWCWNITKLLGPKKWTYYYLYVVIDVYSRYVTGRRLEHRESATFAEELFATTIAREGVDPRLLTVHSDGGTAMTSKTLAQLLMVLGVTKSRSRSHVSNDNPYIESHFKTLKYGASFPGHFANIHQARDFCRRFFAWYNGQHRHSGIALLTPEDVHLGRTDQRRDARRTVLLEAWGKHPERFVHDKPEPLAVAPIAYINQPEPTQAA